MPNAKLSLRCTSPDTCAFSRRASSRSGSRSSTPSCAPAPSARAIAATTAWRACSPRARRARARRVLLHASLRRGALPFGHARGAGNIFFGNCNLRCVYCQNYQISQDYPVAAHERGPGREARRDDARSSARGCHNIGFVSPTHFAPQMAKAVLLAARGARCRSSTTPTPTTRSRCCGCSRESSTSTCRTSSTPMRGRMRSIRRCRTTPERSRAALVEMYRQKGSRLEMGEEGLLRSGLLVRVLVLPERRRGRLRDARLDRRDAVAPGGDLAHGPVLPDPSRGLEREVRRSAAPSRPQSGGRRWPPSRRTASTTASAGVPDGREVLPSRLPRPRHALSGHPRLPVAGRPRWGPRPAGPSLTDGTVAPGLYRRLRSCLRRSGTSRHGGSPRAKLGSQGREVEESRAGRGHVPRPCFFRISRRDSIGSQALTIAACNRRRP